MKGIHPHHGRISRIIGFSLFVYLHHSPLFCFQLRYPSFFTHSSPRTFLPAFLLAFIPAFLPLSFNNSNSKSNNNKSNNRIDSLQLSLPFSPLDSLLPPLFFSLPPF